MKHLTSIYICLIMTISYSFGQSGAIKGKVLTSKGFPAKNVAIKLNSGQQLEVDNEGKYEFNNLEANTYEVEVRHISYSPIHVKVLLKETETKVLDFVLEESNNQILEVLVTGKKPIVDHKVSSSLRVQTPVLELSQNIQTVNSELLSRQQAFNISDGIFKNVSGVSRQTHWNDLFVNIKTRGSQLQAFRNGMNVVASFWGPLSEDMSVVEKVEFVKGPAGFMMSSGSPAGIYNIVTKKPTGNQNAEVSMSLGSFNYYRGSLDLDGKLSKDNKLLYRLNIAGTSQSSFRPFEENKRLVLAPVISYQVDENTKATFEYTYQKAIMTDIGSSYLFSPRGFKSLDRTTSLSQEGLDPLNIDDHSTFLTVEHDLSTNWKLTAQGSYFFYDQIGASSWPSKILEDGKIVRKSDIWDAQSKMLMGQFFVNGNFKTANITHKVLAGLDLGHKNYIADWNTSQLLDSVGGEFDPLNPVYGFDFGIKEFDRSVSLAKRAAIGGGNMNSKYSSIYVQDELGFLENKLRVTLAARFTTMAVGTWGNTPVESKKVTPRIGLSYSIDQNTAVYALYDQAFIPQTGFLLNGSKVKPITGDNYEIGFKRDWFNGKWNTTLAYYQIIKNHELTAGPEPRSSIEIGQKKISGIELDIKGELTKGLNLIANYAYTDGKISKINKDVKIFHVGQRLAGSDKHIANIWLNYEFQQSTFKGLNLQLGANSNIDRATQAFSQDNKERNLEDYYRFDAGIGYNKDKFRINLNVQNLLDTYLIEGGSFYEKSNTFLTPLYSWQAGTPRSFRITLGYKF